MRRILLYFLSSTLLFSSCGKNYSNDIEAGKADALCRRVLGEGYADFFRFKTLSESDSDVFRISSRGRKILIEGNNANSMATGLNYYLKYRCNLSLSYYRPASVSLPATLPKIGDPIVVNARCDKRFFLNYCTFGYSMPWWDWSEWEYFIDWMAMNGINTVLAITGQESVWYKVWTDLGLSGDDVRSYFTGPAHLPWHRMSNIDKWGGPLPQSWLDTQEQLQKQIVNRERELGMKTVLPAFSGHVPLQIKTLYPDANIKTLGTWGGFSEGEACSFLDPEDPLFADVQKRFLEEQTKLYGTDHIYGIDCFNEVTPPSWEPGYLARVGKQVYSTLAAADPDAVWLQMTWMFYFDKRWTNECVKAYITSYPADKSILLDYFCDKDEVWRRTDKFSGVPFIWCYLGNFGGNTMLAGNFKQVAENMTECLRECPNVIGVGSTSEGLDVCNTFMYDYVFERAWNMPEVQNPDLYVEKLSDRRCGVESADGRQAWKLLCDSVYVSRSSSGQCVMATIRPPFGSHRNHYSRNEIEYSNDNILKAINLLLTVDSDCDTYEFDLVNLTRQWLGNISTEIFNKYSEALKKADLEEMDRQAVKMMDIIYDMDKVLACRKEFSLNQWLSAARKWGANDTEQHYYEMNARNLITTWGRSETDLNDYASRSLSGMMTSYYGERWKMFFFQARKEVENNGKFKENAYMRYWHDVNAFEESWWRDRLGKFDNSPSGDAAELSCSDVKEIVKGIISKYDLR